MNPDQDQIIGAVVALADLVRDPFQGPADLVVGQKLGGSQGFLLSGLAGPDLKVAEVDGSRGAVQNFSEIFRNFLCGSFSPQRALGGVARRAEEGGETLAKAYLILPPPRLRRYSPLGGETVRSRAVVSGTAYR